MYQKIIYSLLQAFVLLFQISKTKFEVPLLGLKFIAKFKVNRATVFAIFSINIFVTRSRKQLFFCPEDN